MSFPFYISFALIPSLVWLVFYLRKDKHPEAAKTILKVFCLGILAAALAGILEITAAKLMEFAPSVFAEKYSFLFLILKVFVITAFFEESLKYLVAKNFILTSSELDEPIDIMIYLIVSALGFAALENLLFLLSPLNGPFDFSQTMSLSMSRFIGATFLHTLTSGTIGFFMAISFLNSKNRQKIFLAGLAMAVILHGFFNLAIMKLQGTWQDLAPMIILAGLAIVTTWEFKKLKNLPSICK